MAYRQSHLQTSAASWLFSRSGGTKSSGLAAERLRAQELKFLIAHRVLVSILAGITPFAAFSLSGEVIGVVNLVFVFSLRGLEIAAAADEPPGMPRRFNDSLEHFGCGSGAAEQTEVVGSSSLSKGSLYLVSR